MTLTDSEWLKIVKDSLAKGYSIELTQDSSFGYTRGRSDKEREITTIINAGTKLTKYIEAAIERHQNKNKDNG